MAHYNYDRLSAQDATFLWSEAESQPMHVGGLAVFESGPLQRPDGGIEFERIRSGIEAVLHWIPRYRQKIEWTPIEGWPVWVDDRGFDLGYHIRHIALPKPGGLDQLKELAARIHSRPLDRQHSLWEMWVIEGVEGGEQFALLNKIHHCMIDGAAGADLSQILMSPSPRYEAGEVVPYIPRTAPTDLELWSDSVRRAVAGPLELARDWWVADSSDESEARPSLARRLGGIRQMLRYAITPASETPINGALGPHRRIDWLTMPLDDVKELRRALGCTINDLVLATVAGAMRRYLFRRRVDTRELDFRVAAPVNMRRPDDEPRQGNRVSSWIVPLPVSEEDPIAQLREIQTVTQDLKDSEASLGVETLMEAAEWLPASLLSRAVGLAEGPANMIVTNVPGPGFPLYTVGAKLLALYPLVPLLPGGGLGVALFSYNGILCWGFNADDQRVADVSTFAEDIAQSFEALRAATVSHVLDRRTAPDDAVPIPRNPAQGPKPRARKTPSKASRKQPERTGVSPAKERAAAADVS